MSFTLNNTGFTSNIGNYRPLVKFYDNKIVAHCSLISASNKRLHKFKAKEKHHEMVMFQLTVVNNSGSCIT